MKTVIHPIVFYDDAPAAMRWLQDAFGFEEIMAHADDNGAIVHAEMHLDGAIIMVSSSSKDMGYVSPQQLDGRGSAHINVQIPDPDGHHARAVAAGAKVTYPLEDKSYGGRGYSCVDLEGHAWSFGSYEPSVKS